MVTIEERNRLVMENQNLIHHILKKYRRDTKLYDYDDLVQVANFGLIDAIEKYDESKSEFSTFAGAYIIGYVKKFVAKNTFSLKMTANQYWGGESVQSISLYATIPYKHGEISLLETLPDEDTSIETIYLIDAVKRICDKDKKHGNKDFIYWCLHRIKGLSHREVAEERGVVRQQVSQRLRKLENKLREEYDLDV